MHKLDVNDEEWDERSWDGWLTINVAVYSLSSRYKWIQGYIRMIGWALLFNCYYYIHSS